MHCSSRVYKVRRAYYRRRENINASPLTLSRLQKIDQHIFHDPYLYFFHNRSYLSYVVLVQRRRLYNRLEIANINSTDKLINR